MIYKYSLVVVFFSFVWANQGQCQTGVWNGTSPNNPVQVYAGPGFYYTDPLFVRSGQQSIQFHFGETSAANASEVRVDGGSWTELGAGAEFVTWPNPPNTPGIYEVDFIYVGPGNLQGQTRTYKLTVVPAATARYSDGLGNDLVFWQGGADSKDRPFLMIEGIDSANENSSNSYFALGQSIFERAISQGADLYILNFYDGGRGLYQNADIAESSIDYINNFRRDGNVPFDVSGVSMGGVVARIALARIEAQGGQHDVNHFVSIDAPHSGAVLQHAMVDFIRQKAHEGLIEPPTNLTSLAGKQLLKYNPYALPDQSSDFFDQLDQLNGNGYPHQSVNLGVSFGTLNNNEYLGEQWLRYRVRTYLGAVVESKYFDVTNDVAIPGSYLPRDVTNVWGHACTAPGACGVGELIRYTAQPTFIPTKSALHIENGQSHFDETMTAAEPSFHNELPLGLANRILDWLGYQIPPPNVSVTGTSCIREGYSGFYTAHVSGGAGPFSFDWQMQVPCDDPYPASTNNDSLIVEPTGPSCSGWNFLGTGQQISYSPSSASVPFGTLKIRAVVEDSRGVQDSSWPKYVDFVPDNGDGSCGDILKYSQPKDRSSHAKIRESIPTSIRLRGASPNPFRLRAELTYGLPTQQYVQVDLYNLLGQKITTISKGDKSPGWHEVEIYGLDLATGTYILRLRTEERSLSKLVTHVD